MKSPILNDDQIGKAWDTVDEDIQKMDGNDYRKSNHHKPDTYDYSLLKTQRDADLKWFVTLLRKELPFNISSMSQLDFFNSPFWQELQKLIGE